jgi:predicted amidohydrolase YtcJ
LPNREDAKPLPSPHDGANGSVLFSNGQVWTGAGTQDASALLVQDGRIVAIGNDALQATLPEGIDRVDLDGGFLMPSFGDGHAHPLYGGLEEFGPRVRAGHSVAEIVAEVRRFAEAHPDQEWIIGASYDGSLAPNGLFDAHWLDEAVSDRPVMLRAWDYHTVWCNSRALELAGIDSNTPEPVLGEIPRRDDGSPLGTLREWGAIDLLAAVAPAFTLDDKVEALRRATLHYASLGVTWVQDAWVEDADIDAYLAAAERGVLSTRINLAFLADPRTFPASLPALVAARARIEALAHPLLTAHSIKFFADGVVENETGALLEPYCSGLHDHGMLVWSPENLAKAVAAIDAEGFQTHIHAIGDAAVRVALDAIEHANAVNGPRDRRAVIAHVQLADAADLARFASLGVIATMQPLWAQLDALMMVLTVPRLGPERSDRQYQMATLVASGASLAFGSDWPVSSAAPLDGIAIATSRTTAEGLPAGGWVPQEILSTETALTAYSSGVARQAFADATTPSWGRLEIGASADLVWLAQDPRSTAPSAMSNIAINGTYLAGATTHRAITHNNE